MDLTYVLGVDVGGTNIRMGIVSSQLSVCRHLLLPTTAIASGKKTPFIFLDAVENFLRQGGESISAVCLGFPSIISKDKQVIMQTPNICGLDRIAMADLAKERLKLPVFLEKDVNLLLRYDMETFGLKNQSPVLGFYIGTGFGNSIYIHNTFFSGANGAAGELGHIPIYQNDALCPCGNKGCVETIASGRYFAEQVAQKYPRTNIKDFFRYHKDESFSHEFIELLSYPIATEMNIFDPFAAIIGGGITAMQDFPKKQLIYSIKKKLRNPYPRESAALYFSGELRTAGILGAARYAFDRLA